MVDIVALPSTTIHLLKSSQVITSVSSIVKELVENSLDAGANIISVKLENFGFKKIEIRDNGYGINENDAALVALPHYTSKLKSFNDLDELTSYGFRGEALASVCAVSDVTITSKLSNDNVGHLFTYHSNGKLKSSKPAPSPNGTTVTITNLFSTIPVRLQYFKNTKRKKEELKKIEDLILSFSIIIPQLRINLTHDKNVIYLKTPATTIQESLLCTMSSVAKKLSEKKVEENGISMKVWFPTHKEPICERSTSDRLFIFVNQRVIGHKSIEKLVKTYYSQGQDGCHGKYPVGVIDIKVQPDAIDVNLEPNKDKILFKEEKLILNLLEDLLIDLYGPLKNKCSDEDTTSINEITCTYAALSQDKQLEPNLMDTCEVQTASITSETTEQQINLNINKSDIMSNVESFTDVKATSNYTNKSVLGRVSAEDTVYQAENIEKPINRFQNESIASKNQINKITSEQLQNKDASTSNYNLKDNINPIIFEPWDFDESNKTQVHKITPRKSSSCTDKQIGSQIINNNKLSNSAKKNIFTSTQISDENNFTKSFSYNSLSTIEDDIEFLDSVFAEEMLVDSCVQASTKYIRAQSELSNNSKHIPSTSNDKEHRSTSGNDDIPIDILNSIAKIVDLTTDELSTSNNEDNLCRSEESNSRSSKCQQIDSSKTTQHRFKDTLASSLVDEVDLFLDKSTDNILTDQSVKNNLPEETMCSNNWSKGNIQSNSVTMQPVALARPPLLTADDLTSRPKPNLLKRPKTSDEEQKENTIKTKKSKPNIFDSMKYEVFEGKHVRKSSSAFSLFANDIRHEVLADNPGADFTVIGQEIANRWRNLDDETKQIYNNKALEDQARYQEERRKICENKDSTLLALTPFNRTIREKQTTLDKLLAPNTPEINKVQSKLKIKTKHKVKDSKVKEISVDINSIKKGLQTANKQTKVERNTFQAIGTLGTSLGWLCLQDDVIVAVNIYRQHEVILFKSMLQSYAVASPLRSSPSPFNASLLGQNLWNVLIELKKEKVGDRKFYKVTDERITYNGFKLLLFSGNTEGFTHGEITGQANCVNFYGMRDLQEIIGIIKNNPQVNLQNTRPLKIKNWMKGEAVRISRSAPNICSKQDFVERTSKWLETCNSRNILSNENLSCLHDRPIVTTVFDLECIPLSQECNFD